MSDLDICFPIPEPNRRNADDMGMPMPLRKLPLNGHVMEPEPTWDRQVASTIAGHPLVQSHGEEAVILFEMFVREVLNTVPRPRERT